MPAPYNERQAFERERKELTDRLTNLQAELDEGQTERRERLLWQIRQARKRMAEVARQLAGFS